MKWILFAFLAFPIAQSSAQNLGKQFEWTKSAASRIPLHATLPYYDTTVRQENELTREQLEDNAKYYFHEVFGTDLIKVTGKHKITGCCNYLFNIGNNQDEENIYKVVYLLDITSRDGKYEVEMHDFTIEHLGHEVDIAKKIELAKDGVGAACHMLAGFHRRNLDELKKVHQTMSRGEKPENRTASK